VHSSKHHVPLPPAASQSSLIDDKEPLITLASPGSDNTASTNTTTSTNTTSKTDRLDLVYTLNIRSMVNQLNVFQSFVYSRSPDIIAVTEA